MFGLHNLRLSEEHLEAIPHTQSSQQNDHPVHSQHTRTAAMTEPNSAAAAAAATDADNEQHLPAAASAEDRKAAAALSALNTNEISQESTQEAADAKNLSSAAVQEALGKAMSRLEVSSGKAAGGAGKGGATAAAAQTSQEGVKKKAVKVSSEDVALLVSWIFFFSRWT